MVNFIWKIYALPILSSVKIPQYLIILVYLTVINI